LVGSTLMWHAPFLRSLTRTNQVRVTGCICERGFGATWASTNLLDRQHMSSAVFARTRAYTLPFLYPSLHAQVLSIPQRCRVC
jgi:hypothetical protein